MAFQQVSLDQSIYKKGQAAYSQALRPQGGGTKQLPLSGSLNAPNSSVERMKAEWAAEDKAKKAEREAQSSQLQNIGMQTVQQAQQQKQQVQQQQAQTKQQIESDPEPAAKEMYELMKTLPDEAKTQLLNQIFTPTATGNFIEAGGVKKNMPDKYNPIAGVFLEKGWAMFDPKGNVNLSEPEEEKEEEWYYSPEDNLLYNRKSGDTKPVEVADGTDPKFAADAFNYGLSYITKMTQPSMIETLTPENMAGFFQGLREGAKVATEEYLIGVHKLSKKEAHDIAYSIPIEDRITELKNEIGGGAATQKGDTTMAYNIYDSIKGKEVSQEEKNYYITTYGQETWDIVERKLKEDRVEKKTVKPFVPPPQTEPTAKKKEEPKVKDYLIKMKERRGLE